MPHSKGNSYFCEFICMTHERMLTRACSHGVEKGKFIQWSGIMNQTEQWLQVIQEKNTKFDLEILTTPSFFIEILVALHGIEWLAWTTLNDATGRRLSFFLFSLSNSRNWRKFPVKNKGRGIAVFENSSSTFLFFYFR